MTHRETIEYICPHVPPFVVDSTVEREVYPSYVGRSPGASPKVKTEPCMSMGSGNRRKAKAT